MKNYSRISRPARSQQGEMGILQKQYPGSAYGEILMPNGTCYEIRIKSMFLGKLKAGDLVMIECFSAGDALVSPSLGYKADAA